MSHKKMVKVKTYISLKTIKFNRETKVLGCQITRRLVYIHMYTYIGKNIYI